MQVILAQRRTTSGTQCRPSRIGNRPLPPRARPVRLCEIPYHESRGTVLRAAGRGAVRDLGRGDARRGAAPSVRGAQRAAAHAQRGRVRDWQQLEDAVHQRDDRVPRPRRRGPRPPPVVRRVHAGVRRRRPARLGRIRDVRRHAAHLVHEKRRAEVPLSEEPVRGDLSQGHRLAQRAAQVAGARRRTRACWS